MRSGLLDTVYRTILADPPWQFNDRLPGFARGAERNYSVLCLEEIKTFLTDEGILVAPDARLFLWRVASQQEEALQVCRAWGFQPKTEIVWQKLTKNGLPWFGMGRTVRASHETCLVGQLGRPEVLSKSVRSTFSAKYTEHSGKPDCFYDLVESLSPGPYIELFARKSRPGWDAIGDELL